MAIAFEVTIDELKTTLNCNEYTAYEVFRREFSLKDYLPAPPTIEVRLVDENIKDHRLTPLKLSVAYYTAPGSTVVDKATFLAYLAARAPSVLDIQPKRAG
jgi:hypothetical protein